LAAAFALLVLRWGQGVKLEQVALRLDPRSLSGDDVFAKLTLRIPEFLVREIMDIRHIRALRIVIEGWVQRHFFRRNDRVQARKVVES